MLVRAMSPTQYQTNSLAIQILDGLSVPGGRLDALGDKAASNHLETPFKTTAS